MLAAGRRRAAPPAAIGVCVAEAATQTPKLGLGSSVGRGHAVISKTAGAVRGEFNLVCLALNLRRMATMIEWA